MPWETKTVMEQRKAFVEAVENREGTISALCREYGISRKTAYKWLNRDRDGQSLCDQSRCPHLQPFKTDPDTEQLILSVRSANPVWGGRKIKAVLEAAGYEGIPSAKTCGNILRRNGCISPEESLRHQPYQRFEREKCNQLWQTDFKGDFLLGNGTRCFPLTILDDHSRYGLRIEAKTAATGVKESFIQVFMEFGLPDAILSDNGAQFSGFRGGYAQFERFLMDLDIIPIHGRIMHPQTQGKIERFHRTLKQEALAHIPRDMAEAQRHFDEWLWKYNELRPHNALGLKTPGQVYVPSQREYREPETWEYDSGARMVKVNNWGYLRFGSTQVYLSETMRDTYVEIRPADGDIFQVIYRNFRIAEVDPISHKLLNRHIRKL